MTMVQKVIGDPFFHGKTMRCGIFLDQHSLVGEIWQMGITQTSHASLYPGSLSGMADPTVPVFHFFCGLVCAAQSSAISSPGLL